MVSYFCSWRAIQWMLYELASHPQVQEEIRSEVQCVQHHSIDAVNNHCPLLDSALKETLRLHPAILENHHEVDFAFVTTYRSCSKYTSGFRNDQYSSRRTVARCQGYPYHDSERYPSRYTSQCYTPRCQCLGAWCSYLSSWALVRKKEVPSPSQAWASYVQRGVRT